MFSDYCKKILKVILNEGFEIGLHGSFNAYNNSKQMNKEKKKLESLINKQIIGYRNHYLQLKIPNTWRILKENGFKYDSTFGYRNLIGFRGGIPYPFITFDPRDKKTIDILEIPLNVMDVTVFEYMKNEKEDPFTLIKRLIDITEKYHGVLTLNWHNDKFDNLHWRKYEDLYLKILKEVKKRGAWLTNCEGIKEWWNKENQPS